MSTLSIVRETNSRKQTPPSIAKEKERLRKNAQIPPLGFALTPQTVLSASLQLTEHTTRDDGASRRARRDRSGLKWIKRRVREIHRILFSGAEKSKTLFMINHEAQAAAIDLDRHSFANMVPPKLSNHHWTEAGKDGPAAAGVNRRYRTT